MEFQKTTTPTATDDHRVVYFEPPLNWILGATFACLSVCSIVGNTLVLLIITRYKRMRTQTNLLLGNLASIDLLTGLLAIPFSVITAIKGTWILGDTACQVNGFLNALFAGASIHTLMYISLHKYLSLRSSGTSMIISSSVRNTILMISAAWIWGFLFATGLVAGWTRIEYKSGTTQCGPKIPESGNIREVSHSIFTSASNYLIPFAVICFCYVSIFRTFRRSIETLKCDFQALSHREYLFRQRKIATTLVIIFLAFLICLTPYICYSSTVALSRDKSLVPSVLNPVAYIFLHLSSCVNPVIYAFRSKEFAAAYKIIVRVICCENRRIFFAEPKKHTKKAPPTGLRRRSLEAVRFLARKTQKMHQLPFEVHTPSTTSRDHTSVWLMSRIPRRRSLSMLALPAGSPDSPVQQLAYLSQECDIPTMRAAVRYGTISTTGRRHRLLQQQSPLKSTIAEEHSSQLDPTSTSNFPTSVYSSGTDTGCESIEQATNG